LPSFYPATDVKALKLVSWSLTSLFSTNMAISETRKHWRNQCVYARMCNNVHSASSVMWRVTAIRWSTCRCQAMRHSSL